ncbi:MAG: flagellar biosynthesis protein FlhB [Clostridiales bacterium]|jgi:flagellar biosynthetic protein FlhB|nr:flagellar biosynthesis protein FlhB [Clostridiales bacterium]
MKPINAELYSLIPMNLGFFNQNQPASEKTEPATPKKREKAREEGQVAQSQEIGTAILFIAAFIALRVFAPGMLERLSGMMTLNFVLIGDATDMMNLERISRHIWEMFGQIILLVLPLAAVVVLLGILSGILQVGWKPTVKPLKPKFSKLSPLKGIKKIFGARMFMELFKAVAKFTIILLVVFWVIASEVEILLTLFQRDLWAAIGFVANLWVTVGITVGIFYLFVAAADYAFNRRKHEKELRMTKQEVKDEFKQTEGDPLVKSRIRQKMRETSMRRMMQEVPGADVVITNPTHYAVALRYDRMSLSAPKVIAKGADNLAHKIRDLAREHEVVIVEDKPLARTLYSVVDIGDEIPAELWQAVAEILAYVYSVKNVQHAAA